MESYQQWQQFKEIMVIQEVTKLSSPPRWQGGMSGNVSVHVLYTHIFYVKPAMNYSGAGRGTCHFALQGPVSMPIVLLI